MPGCVAVNQIRMFPAKAFLSNTEELAAFQMADIHAVHIQSGVQQFPTL